MPVVQWFHKGYRNKDKKWMAKSLLHNFTSSVIKPDIKNSEGSEWLRNKTANKIQGW